MNRIVSSRSLIPSGTRTTAGPRPRVARFVLAAVLAAGLNACLGSRADALTYYVDRNNAACLNTGAGTELQPYCTIAAALTAHGVAGNTIMVKPGTYREQVTINTSGVSGSPLIVQAFASGVVIDGSDDFSNAAQWTLVSGNVWLASSVNWYPKQVFLDGARCDSSSLAVTSLTPRTFRWVSGTGLYVNAGSGSPSTHAAAVGHRNYGFSLFGRSFITIDGFNVLHSEDRGVYLNGSCTNVSVLRNVITYTGKMGIQVVGGSGMMIGSNNVHDCMDHGISFITNVTNSVLEDNESYRNARPIDRVANGIYLFGCPNNTIRQNRTHDNEDTGIHLQSGSNNCISYLNRSWNNGDHGYDHLQAMGTIHNCDVAYGNFKDGFSIEGNATGTQLHNCIAVENGLTTNEFDLWVDSGSITGFVSDYNIFWNSTAQPPVKYIATLYPTVAAYSTASGKDAHTLQANPLFVNPAAANFHLLSTSPAIDNANSGSPNWPTLDADDLARFNANGVPNTGVGPINYGDRGAYEFRTSGTNQAPNGVINTPTAAVTIVAGQSVSFSCTGTDADNDLPLAFAWNFAGGAPNSSLEDPGAVVFNTAGTYVVSLTVTDALGLADPTPDTRTITVTANAAPNGVINTPTGAVTIAAGQSVNFTSTGSDPNNNLPLTYFWNFGGGATNSTVEDPGAVVFATGGTYTVTLVVTDALGLADPTPDTRTITVTTPTNQAPNGVINTPAGPTTIIAGQSVNFTGTGTDPDNNLPLTFAWNFGGGATNSTVEDPGAVVFATAGTYTVSFTVRDGLGLADPTPDTRTITVTANTAPNGVINTPTAAVTIAAGQSVNFTGTGSDANNNVPLTFLWNFGGGATNSTVEDPGAVVFTAPGTYTVSFTVTDALGLADPTPDTRTITVTGTNQAPNGTISAPAAAVTITAGQSVTFTGSGTDPNNNLPLTYLWNFGGGATNSTVQNPGAVVFATAGTYTVNFTVTDALGLADPTPDTRVITVNASANQAPNGVINTPAGPVTITAGQTVNFTGTGTDPDNNLPLTFAWNFGGGATNSTVEDPGNVTFATAGTYTVTFTVRDGLGLADATPDTRVITVNPVAGNQAPNGTIGTPSGPVTITAGQTVSFTGSGTDPDNNLPLTYAWNFGGGATNSTAQNPGAVAFANAGTFTVSFTVTDGLGLADPTPDTRTITVNPVSGGGCAQNIAANPSFESGTTGWKGVGATIAQAAGGSAGSFCLRLTGGASTSSFYVEDSPRNVLNATAGVGYHYSAMVRSDAAHGSVRIRVMEYLAGTKVGQLDSPAVTLSTAWQKVEVDYTPVQTGSEIYFTVKDAPVAVSEVFDVDEATICPLGGTPNQAPNGTIGTPAGNVTIAAGQSVNFTGSGTDPDNNLPLTYSWNFGGGASSSTLQNPGLVVFATAGTYTVTFTVRDGLGAADPTPDTRTITVTGGNQAPNGTIGAPVGNVTIAAGQTVTFGGSGTDPDNNLPLTYLWNFGGGATNSTAQNPGAVTFANAGTFTVSFTVIDALNLSDPTPDTRTITVTGGAGNQAPNGVINTPAANVTITAGQSVSFTGTGSDPDNNLPLTFAWNFGGGAANSTVEDPGLVAFPTAGTYTVSFTVRDGLGLADPTPDTRTITVNPISGGGCASNLLPNPGMESGTTGWKGVGATIAQVAGGSSGSFSLRLTGPASTSSFYVEDSPHTISNTTAGAGYSYSAMVRSDASTGAARIRIMEYLAGTKVGQLDSPAVTLSPNWQKLEVSYTPVQTGSVLYFTVKDNPVAISETFDVDDATYCPLAAPLAQQAGASQATAEVLAGGPMKAVVAPNPMVGLSQLKFSTTRTGPLRVAIFDVTGRRVRMVVDDAQAKAGLHIVPLDDRGDNGSRLDSGIYFYRIRSADGLEQGRFLIMN